MHVADHLDLAELVQRSLLNVPKVFLFLFYLFLFHEVLMENLALDSRFVPFY